MTTAGNPFFTPEFAGPLVAPSLTAPLDPRLSNSTFLLPCAGSQLILSLFAHFLEQALPIFHTLLIQTADTRLVAGRMVAYFPEPQASTAMLTPNQRDMTLYYLTEVIGQLNVTVGPTVNDAGGTTSIQPTRTITNFPGRGSTITISSLKTQKLNEAFANDQTMAQQVYMFDLAVLLMHELSHAITMAVLPIGWGGNCFLGTGHTDEIGYEVENRLFGGLMQKDAGAIYGPAWNECFDHMLVQREWPHPHTLDTYRRTPEFSTLLTQGPEVSRITRIWKVPFSYINGMFLDSFWVDVPYREPNALHLWREKGLITIAMRAEKHEGRHVFGMFLPSEREIAVQHVPFGFVLREHGMLTRADGAV